MSLAGLSLRGEQVFGVLFGLAKTIKTRAGIFRKLAELNIPTWRRSIFNKDAGIAIHAADVVAEVGKWDKRKIIPRRLYLDSKAKLVEKYQVVFKLTAQNIHTKEVFERHIVVSSSRRRRLRELERTAEKLLLDPSPNATIIDIQVEMIRFDPTPRV